MLVLYRRPYLNKLNSNIQIFNLKLCFCLDLINLAWNKQTCTHISNVSESVSADVPSLLSENSNKCERWAKSNLYIMNSLHLGKWEAARADRIWWLSNLFYCTPAWTECTLSNNTAAARGDVSVEIIVSTHWFHCLWFLVWAIKKENLIRFSQLYIYKAPCWVYATAQEKSYGHYHICLCVSIVLKRDWQFRLKTLKIFTRAKIIELHFQSFFFSLFLYENKLENAKKGGRRKVRQHNKEAFMIHIDSVNQNSLFIRVSVKMSPESRSEILDLIIYWVKISLKPSPSSLWILHNSLNTIRKESRKWRREKFSLFQLDLTFEGCCLFVQYNEDEILCCRLD